MSAASVALAFGKAALEVAPSVAAALMDGKTALAKRRAREKLERTIDNEAAKLLLKRRKTAAKE